MIVKGKLTRKQMLAMDYFASILLTPQLKKHIIVAVTFKSKMSALGFTCVEDYNKAGKPREFVLEIYRKQSENEILRTIAHEMVHVKQYAYGELDEEGKRWMNREIDHDKIPYANRPWEIEAYSIGDLIYKDFKDDYRRRNSSYRS